MTKTDKRLALAYLTASQAIVFLQRAIHFYATRGKHAAVEGRFAILTDPYIIAAIITFGRIFTSSNSKLNVRIESLPEELQFFVKWMMRKRNKVIAHSDITADFEHIAWGTYRDSNLFITIDELEAMLLLTDRVEIALRNELCNRTDEPNYSL